MAAITESERTLRAALIMVFDDEWRDLSSADRALIVRDCTEDGGVDDLAEYRRNIGAGNLASYARVMRVRFAKKQSLTARKSV